MRNETRGFTYRVTLFMMMTLVATVAGATSNEDSFVNPPDCEVVIGDEMEGQGKAFTSPYVVSSAEWRNDGIDMDGFFYSFSRGGWRSNGSTICMMAPVFIARNVTLDDFWVTVDDTDDSVNVVVYLKRVNNYSGAVETVASVISTGDTGIQNLSELDLTHLTSDLYSYYLTSCSSSTSIFVYQARIWYTE